MPTYNVSFDGSVLKIGFGEAAQNDQIVKDAKAAAEAVKAEIQGQPVLKISGPASLPVAMLLAHEFNHIVGSVACFDPKLNKFVICISHNPDYAIGDLID